MPSAERPDAVAAAGRVSVLHRDFSLSFGQIGLLSLVYQITASILQPLVGLYTDHRPKPYSLPFAMLASMTGLLTLAFGSDYHTLLVGAALLGLGSSIFHPESSRIARLASGVRTAWHSRSSRSAATWVPRSGR